MSKMYHIQSLKQEDLRENGTSKHVQVKEGVTTEDLVAYGFTNHNPDGYYFSKMIAKEISFNVTIDKKTLSDLRVDVLDEQTLQPFDYQYLLLEGEYSRLLFKVFDSVDEELNRLQEAGILTGYKRGDYV